MVNAVVHISHMKDPNQWGAGEVRSYKLINDNISWFKSH